MNKKSLTIVHINAYEQTGGAGKVLWRLHNEQHQKGHDVHILAGRITSQSNNSHLLDITVSEEYHKFCTDKGFLYYECQESHKLVDHPQIRNADIIHLHVLHGGFFNPFTVLLLTQIKPVIWTFHDMQAFTGHCCHSFTCNRWQTGCGECPELIAYPELSVDSTAMLWQDKQLLYHHSLFQIVTPSQWMKNIVSKSMVNHLPIELIYNGVDTSIFRRYDTTDIKRQFKIPDNAIVVGGVSCGGPLVNTWKGSLFSVLALQHMFQKYDNMFYIGIGTDIGARNEGTLHIPFVKDELTLAHLYSMMDIFLIPSIADNCPLVVLEALACGIPIVAFETGGIPELVRHHQEGLVVEKRNINELIKGIDLLFQNADLRKRLGKNARHRATTHFDHHLISNQYEKLYYNWIEQWHKKRFNIPHIPIHQLPIPIQLNAFEFAYQSVIQQLIQEGESYFQEGQIERAKKCFINVLEKDDKQSIAWNNLGVIFFHENESQMAEKCFKLAIDLNNSFQDAMNNLNALKIRQ